MPISENKRMNCAACGRSFDIESHKGGKTFDYGLIYICGKKCMGIFLIDRVSKQKEFKIGNYVLEIDLHNRYWIRYKSGKDLEVGEKELEKLIEDFYKENF
jgi:hypothetical protein